MIEDYILFEFLGLRTYPKQCWINFTPEVKKMQKNGSFKRTVIENGCAVYDKEMLAIIKQDDDGDSRFASWTKIAIPISKNLIAFSVNGSNKNGQYGNITVSCEIFICSGNMLATFQNVPLGDHQIPDWLILYDSSTQYVELEGSITVVTSNNSDSDSVSLPSNYLFIEAENVSPAEEVQSGLKTEENVVQQQVVCPISEGIPIYAVIFISILSFAFGLIFVASLWIIHNKTDPLRKIRCMEPSRAAALASVYRDPIVRSTNSTAFMAVPVNERQRLVIDMP
ncbi:unnamed protein product [Dracunculus medinensis]|uniref:ZP domain-containing protein n=1 Tax=Dracunculus medinensis TaxID=318479 RepID=A0A0N4U8X2_DRAME|nr:unnamed protein product [Dracunculus medinensis]